jgi:glycosyltransferase involved in cell wall biosynthesis
MWSERAGQTLMKIAIDVHSVGSQAGGNETYFRQLLTELTQDPSDNQYTLFCTRPAELEETARDPRFRLARIPQNPLLRLCFSLPRLLSIGRPDVFHCQYVMPLWGKTKTVVTIHDLAYEHFPESFHRLERAYLKSLVPRTARRADHILTVSNYSAADIAGRYGIPREKITVAYLAASQHFRPRDKQGAREHLARHHGIDSPFILYVGRIQPRKNLLRLAEAYAQVRRRGVEAKLLIVGKNDFQAERLSARIAELGLRESVIFPGFISFEDLPMFYNAAEVFVFPSLFEGFGLPVLESMASGVPTITSFGSSLEEVAGDAALLVDPFDTNSLASALVRVLEDTALQGQLVSRGLRRSAQFKPGDLGAKALAIYRSLQG